MALAVLGVEGGAHRVRGGVVPRHGRAHARRRPDVGAGSWRRGLRDEGSGFRAQGLLGFVWDWGRV